MVFRAAEPRSDSVMGRKKDLNELGKRGPGRKSKKQKPPQLPAHLKEKEDAAHLGVKKKLGGRIKQRAKKRAFKVAMKAVESEKKERRKASVKVKDLEEGKFAKVV